MIIANKQFNKLKQQLKEKSAQHYHTIDDYTIQSAYMKVVDYPVFFASLEKDILGTYNHDQRMILLNSSLQYSSIDDIFQIYLHEIGHAIDYLRRRKSQHDPIFRDIVKSINGTNFKSSGSVGMKEYNPVEESVTKKIKKLLAMSGSSNENESQIALVKANELMIKHNINNMNNTDDSQNLYRESYSLGKKRSQQQRSIINIISQCFNVYAIFERNYNGMVITFIGEKSNMEIATYAYDFLNKKLPKLYNQVKDKYKGYGQRARIGFMLGFESSFIKKMTTSNQVMSQSNQTDLVLYKKQIEKVSKELFFPKSRISSENRKVYYDANSYNDGKKAGKNFSINPSVKNNNRVLSLA